MAPTKYSLDDPALNKAANCPGKTSVIKIPKIIKPIEKIIHDCDRDYYLDPQDAIEYGLIDEII